MNYILFDGSARNQLLPFTYTRPVADIRVGILTIREKWEKMLGFTSSTVTEDYLIDKFPMIEMEQNIFINASVLPTEHLVSLIQNLSENKALFIDDEPLAFFAKEDQEIDFETFDILQYTNDDILRIENTWDIFKLNGEAIKRDFKLLTTDRESQLIPEMTLAFNKDQTKFTLHGVEDTPGIAYKILGPVNDKDISVDVIVQNISVNGKTDFTFTVDSEDEEQVKLILE